MREVIPEGIKAEFGWEKPREKGEGREAGKANLQLGLQRQSCLKTGRRDSKDHGVLCPLFPAEYSINFSKDGSRRESYSEGTGKGKDLGNVICGFGFMGTQVPPS